MSKLMIWLTLCCAFACSSKKGIEAGSPLPSINMLLVDSTNYKSDQIAAGRYTVFVYFRTDCAHCKKETADIVKNDHRLTDVNFIFLTPKSLSELRQYAAFFKLPDHTNFKVATDNKLEFLKYYGPPDVPFLVIYNRANKLYRIYEGPVSIDSLAVLNNGL